MLATVVLAPCGHSESAILQSPLAPVLLMMMMMLANWCQTVATFVAILRVPLSTGSSLSSQAQPCSRIHDSAQPQDAALEHLQKWFSFFLTRHLISSLPLSRSLFVPNNQRRALVERNQTDLMLWAGRHSV